MATRKKAGARRSTAARKSRSSSKAKSPPAKRASSGARTKSTVTATQSTAKETFLAAYDREHATTMKVLRSYPLDQLDLRPHPRLKTARELAWVFALERWLATKVFQDALARGEREPPPAAPQSWDEILDALERAHQEFRALVSRTSLSELRKTSKFYVAPKTVGDVGRLDFFWFLLHDQIHHRGQFSVYLRMANGRVPSIYGASGDEPWT